MKTVISLAGLESVGKSALFRHLTGHQTGIETNVKGSTVVLSRGEWQRDSSVKVVDTPGMRSKDDSLTTQMALDETKSLEEIILVVKAPHLKNELLLLEDQLDLRGKKVIVVATHKDRYDPCDEEKLFIKELLNVPVIWCNTRSMNQAEQEDLGEAIRGPSSRWELNRHILSFLPDLNEERSTKWLEQILFKNIAGPLLALFLVICMFGVPVFISYSFSNYLQSVSEKLFVEPLNQNLMNLPEFIQELLIGNYGALTLGLYSFIWAFPVVFLVGFSVAITEETGLQEHITHALNPWLMKIGLTGRDLIPVITGFGCNVIAVMQSRSCSSCTRSNCISMISFGSACSYQIGASLSLFGSAGQPLLFLPYIFVLFIVGAIHTRVWEKSSLPLNTVSSLPYLQPVTWRGTVFRLKGILKQFIAQAMPIFITICLTASVLNYLEIMKGLAYLISPLLTLLSLPADVAPGVIFSIFRKDGMMVLNEGEGSLLQNLEIWQLFITVYLASTLSSCLVTLFSIYKEMGGTHAFKVLGKQMITSIISTFLLTMILTAFFK
ncbi:FeoB small GTPase domain-containing protein [Halobacillus sp. Marseille-P3879]|uniref:FeoB small GTPase domain-containing protein n=1 Tax=Halobacillus sp. Marseille-P3879 TaxID=2045014 RepID=UPI00135A16D0|nr:FeoB small GTPase domain-containing protein [Halobacillus sp. Marseille-P3879]